MTTLYERIKEQQTARQKPVKPFLNTTGTTPLSIQLLTKTAPQPKQTPVDQAAIIQRDRERGVSISQGTPDPVQVQRQALSKIPVIGKFLTGTGPQGPSNSLYNPGSFQQSLVEGGIVGFMLEGFQKKLNPTRAEVGERIFSRYEDLADLEPDEDRRLRLAVEDTIANTPGNAKSIQDLMKPGVTLSKQEKEALFWTNLLEDTFAVLDAPVFVGSTKIPKNALLTFLKKTDDIEEIIPRLRMVGISEDVAQDVAPKIAKSGNEIQIARYLEDAKKAVTENTKPSLFSRIQEKVATKLTPGKTNRFEEVATASKAADETPTVIKRADEVAEGTPERFFRSSQGGSKFEEIVPDEVVPAFIREDLDTFVVKQGDEFQVIEGKTGQQIGDSGRNVAEAVQKAKSDVESMGNERLSEFISNSPLSPRYTQVAEQAPKTTAKSITPTLPKGVITADQLRLTDKAAARRLAKLENMAGTASTVDNFVEKTGITKPALDKTVQKQGYKDAEQFYNVNRPKQVSKTEAASRSKVPEPDTRMAPDEDSYYSLLAEQQAGDAFVLAAKKDESEAVVDNLRAVFADMKGIEVDDAMKFTEEDLFKVETEYQFMMEALMDDPARSLVKYVSPKTGQLPEVTGKETMGAISGSGKKVRNSEFGRRGDQILQEIFGYERQMTSREAQELVDAYLERRAKLKEVFDNMRQVRNSIRLAKQMNTFVEVNQKKLAAEFMKNRKALSAIVEAAEKAGFRKGVAKGNEKYEILVDKLRTRRNAIGGIKWRYSLSNSEMRKAQEYAQKEMNDLSIPDDPRFMTKEEFTEYSAKMEEYARDAEARRVKRGIVKTIIEQKDLKNTENLREVMGLPTLSEMTIEQLGRYEKVLNKFQDGDEFLSKRTLEVIDRTALKGARTTRQVQEFLAQEIKKVLGREVAPGELQNLTAGASDYLRWDTALAESKPFYGFMVHRAQKHIMEGEANFLRIQERVLKLADAAKKSRIKANSNKIKALKRELKTTTDPDARKAIKKRMKTLGWRANVKQKIVPTYSRVINYLEARGDDKEMWWKTLTKEEQEYATFVRNYYNSAYNYLSYINELHGSRYIDAYFTHVRKGFLEKWTDDGFVAAIKNMWDAQKEDMAIANIIDSDTGRILPKSKFFQFALKRTGEGEVSQNLTQVFLKYAQLLERKKMLDKMVPELDVYTSSLTPKEMTQRGLEMDRTMKEFVNNYLNTKRGRKFNYGGIIKQNGPADILLRAGNTMVSFLDLGLNFTAGAASMVGEQVTNFVALGNRGTLRGFKRRIWDTGMKRLIDPNATKILKEAEPFIGRNIWTEIAEVDRPIFDKAMQTMFGLFSQFSVEASKIYLLGSLTEAELKAGKISAQRMADMRLEAGRWRDMGNSVKSIVGATSPGSSFTKYKSWAIPIMRTTAKNVSDLAAMLKKGEFKQALTAKQTKELMREIEVTALAVIVGNMIAAEENDDSALGKLRNRIKQEALTILGGVDPTVFLATPRLYSWLQQMATNLKQLALLEEYKTDSKYGDKGDLKGLGGIKQQFTPGFIRQFLGDNKSGSSVLDSIPETKAPRSALEELDALNELDTADLDALDELDNLDDLDALKELDSL